jgi:hypothetical protein
VQEELSNSSIVALDTPNGATKLRGHVNEEVRDDGGVRLLEQWIGPQVVSATFRDDQVILVASD